jgi:hypothetical protein
MTEIMMRLPAQILRISKGFDRSKQNLYLFFLDPGFNHSFKRGEKFFCPSIFCSHKYYKIASNFIFEHVKQFFLAQHYEL